jgi:hypothetical protein
LAGRQESAAIDIARTGDACPGAATSFLLRTIALHAGRFAPGIQERMFHELHTARFGGTLDRVEQWLDRSRPELYRLGYRVGARRVAFETDAICNWVAAGEGYRGALLITGSKTLYPDLDIRGEHAIALTAEREGDRGATLVMIDPLPTTVARRPPPATLADAHRAHRNATIVFYWSGWS